MAAIPRKVLETSYDLYCYRPTSSTPDNSEAEALVEAFNAAEETGGIHSASPQLQEQIAAALVAHNPRLDRFECDYDKIAEALKTIEEEARRRYSHIELNTPEGDIAVQLTVYGDHVGIAIPYWYEGNKADEAFSEVSGYLRIIRRTAGLFVYDPQTGSAFDPDATDIRDHHEYDKVVKDLPRMAASAVTSQRPWWKFW